jgi:hypothetical protein
MEELKEITQHMLTENPQEFKRFLIGIRDGDIGTQAQ